MQLLTWTALQPSALVRWCCRSILPLPFPADLAQGPPSIVDHELSNPGLPACTLCYMRLAYGMGSQGAANHSNKCVCRQHKLLHLKASWCRLRSIRASVVQPAQAATHCVQMLSSYLKCTSVTGAKSYLSGHLMQNAASHSAGKCTAHILAAGQTMLWPPFAALHDTEVAAVLAPVSEVLLT